MGGGKNTPKVYDYLLSEQVGIAHGRIDFVNRIRIKDKLVFGGKIDRRTNICVDMPDLFGGDEKEGGVQGVIEVYMGDPDQLSSVQLAKRFDRTPSTTPGFRGLSQLFFRGRGRQPGFKWITNNYYLPSFDVSVTDIPWTLDEAAETALAVIEPIDCGQYPDKPSGNTTGTPAGFLGALAGRLFGSSSGNSRQMDLPVPLVNAGAIYPPWSGASLLVGSRYAEYRIADPDDVVESFCDDGSELDGYLQFLYPDGNSTRQTSLPRAADVDAGRVRFRAELTLQGHSNLNYNGLEDVVALAEVHFYSEVYAAVLAIPVDVPQSPVGDVLPAYSANGAAWYTITRNDADEYSDVAWFARGKRFVAISPGGVVAWSPDGREWAKADFPTADNTPRDWAAVAYSPDLGIAVAVSRDGAEQIAVTEDGETWEAYAVPGAHPWSAICWSPALELFVMVAEDGEVATSLDGATWDLQVAPVAAEWKSVCWSPEYGLFAAVGAEPGLDCVMTSPDGVTWTAKQAPNDADWRVVAWHPGSQRFVAAGFALDPNVQDAAMVSEDGDFWEPITAISAQGVTDIVWAPDAGRMVAAGPDGLFYSGNGRTWTRGAQGAVVPGRKLAVSRGMHRGVIGPGVPGGYAGQSISGEMPTARIDTVVPRGARFARLWYSGVMWFPIFAWATVEYRHAELVWTSGSGASAGSIITEDYLGPQPDANPAHIIYELMTDPEWGKGEDPSLIDIPSHTAAAQTLYDEQFGLSFMWSKSGDIEAMIQDVIDHIKAVYYQDPATAKWTLKLLRGDYDPNNLKEINPDNAVIENSLRRGWGELVNEIVVTWTNPETEEEETVTSHNTATYVTEGGYVSEGRNYHAIRTPCLAQRVADRDVVEAGYPLWSGTAHLLRDEWDITPGSVYRLNWPEDDIANMIVRVMNVDYGKPGARTIKASLVEDIFGVVGLDGNVGQTPLWSDPWSAPASPLTDSLAMTPPLPELLRGGATAEDVDDASPGSPALLLGTHDSTHVFDVSAVREVVQPNGDTLWQEVLAFPPTPSALLEAPLDAEAVSAIDRDLIDRLGQGSVTPGSRLLITDPGNTAVTSGAVAPDAFSEIVFLRSFDLDNQEWTVDRGIYDTVPRDWPVGARVWVLPGSEALDPTIHGPTDPPTAVPYLLLPRMGQGQLPLGEAPATNFYAIRREDRPFRPADCQIDGNGFADTIYDTAPFPTDVEATWVHRNRWSDDAIVTLWDDPDAVPEAGQTVTIRIVENRTDPPENALAEYTNLTGNSLTIPVVDLGPLQGAWVQFIAVRDGLESLQFAERYVYVGTIGWDFTWSGKYGR